MSVARLTRAVHFTALHRYHRPDWSDERNLQVFGECGRAPGHAHDYTCEVTVRGPIAPDTGMIVDLEALDRALNEEVVRRFHGGHINRDIAEFAFGRTIPTCEALAVFIWDRIAPRLPQGVSLERVRVAEDPTLSAEYRGGT